MIDTAIPCGLVLNELLSNSLKHGYPGGNRGRISIRLRKLEQAEIEVRVADDGVGLPPDFDFRKDGRMGSQTVVALVESQLGGSIHFEPGPGFACVFSFPNNLSATRV